MKVVVADSSPLNYLILIGEVDLLARLFGEVLIPDLVAKELADSEAPSAVVKWASQFPSWISVRPTPLSLEPFEKLDAGEWAAILLPERQTSAVLLLIDDAAGRAEAERRNIPTTGTLGIIQALRSADLRIYRRPWPGFGRQISVARRYFSINCWLKMHSANLAADQRDRSDGANRPNHRGFIER